MNIPAPKRYANAMIIHFILAALFLPTYWTEYWHYCYQDYILTNVIGALITINIFLHWKFDLKPNILPAALLSLGVIAYNITSFYIYYANPDRFFWKKDHLNVTLAFLFFIALLVMKDARSLITDKVIRWTIRGIIVTNLLAIILRLFGYSHVQMMCFHFWKVPYDSEVNNFLGWFCRDASEYAFLLLLFMSFFIVYKDLFINKWTYLISQLLLLICLSLTNSTTFLLAAGILFACQIAHSLIHKKQIPQKYVWISFPCITLLLAGGFTVLFNKVHTFSQKSLILKGNWRMIKDDPMGLGTTFGVLSYYVDGVKGAIDQAHNVFLNHMLRHSLPVGIIFTLMFAVIIVCAFLHKPTYQTYGIWTALLILLNMNYSLQTVHLPLTLFLIYCIFFLPHKQAEVSATIKQAKHAASKPDQTALQTFDILDLDETTTERRK